MDQKLLELKQEALVRIDECSDLNKLNELKLINDSEYAKEYVLYAIRKLFGPEKIYVDLKELNVYLDCLYENEIEKFDCFKIIYKVLPKIQ